MSDDQFDSALPLPREGTREQAGTDRPSPCQGGGREGVKEPVRLFNRPQYKARRISLRKNQTAPEQRFWRSVRQKQLGVKFRRQHGIGHYIVDFYCPEKRLVVELDGESHFITAEAKNRDTRRDLELRELGLTVMRFSNEDIMHNLEGVLAVVLGFVNGLSDPTPALPLPGEGADGASHSDTCQGEGQEVIASTVKEELGYGA
ncbi:endonuclease domain-containing protein [Endozoicomonas gorgoniicola]|uniref:Endonuclease domain-containing protein n=1 Tax=Endozoicomonas gorgoniicola TaxID=1234144 RepID=A0ABT3MQE5_9GAMM|nr:endonuclease domain-containing protein [Endozoicomonas gorgoniicola]MCW7551338.1 endonuclease domain-containing protein [Endozoicomonas gorgoniicola]